MQPLPRTPPRPQQTSRLFRFDDSTTLSLPMITPQPGDVCNVMLQISKEGIVNVSCLALNNTILPSYSSYPNKTHRASRTAHLVARSASLPPVRIRIIGHSQAESRNGEQFMVYLLEYEEASPTPASSSDSPIAANPISPTNKPLVVSKRFSDFYDLHRQLSLNFVCLPPFPSRSFIRSESNNDALVKEREVALSQYMQLIAMRQDIRRHGDLNRFLHEDSVMDANAQAKKAGQTESEREREIDARIRGEEKAAEQTRIEAQKQSEANTQKFDLLIDQYHVQHTTHIDINAFQEKTEKAQELRQTTFTPKQSQTQTNTQANSHNTNSTTQSKSGTTSSAALVTHPYAAVLTFLTRSPVFTIHRVLLPTPNLLFICGSDDSSISKIDVFFSSLFSSVNDKKKETQRRAKAQEKRDIYIPPEQEAAELKAQADKDRIAQYPLGGFYAFHRTSLTDPFTPTLSLFFERELTDLAWDSKRQWIYVSTDNGQVHVYAPQHEDWSIVKKVWSIQMHSKYINELMYNNQQDALFSISHSGTCSRFDLPSISVNATLTHTTGRISGMAYDSEFDRVFLSCWDRHIYVYDSGRIGIRKEKLLGVMKGHEGNVRCVDYHVESGMLVSGGFDQQVILWQVAAPGKESQSVVVARLIGHSGRVKSVAFDNTGTYIVSGDAHGHVMIWTRVAALPILAFVAHTGPVLSVTMRDQYVVTGSEDKTAKVWALT